MTSRPFARRAVVAAAVLVAVLLAAPQTRIDRWITYGTQSSNTFSVQAVDSAGNRSPTSSVTLTNQTC